MSTFRPPQGALLAEKSALRTEVKKALRSFPLETRQEEDRATQEKVLKADWFQKSKRVCAYLSCSKLREVCTDDVIKHLLERGSALYVPRVMDSSSQMRMLRVTSLEESHIDCSSMGIREPKLALPTGEPREDVMSSSEPLDLILLPGLAFDKSGGRLGRGGGYYDKFLTDYLNLAKARSWEPPLLAALAYSVQVLDRPMPMDDSDIHVNLLVTGTGIHFM